MTIHTVDWLEEVANNYQNREWFDANIEDIYETLHRLIRHDQTINRAIDTFLLIFPLLIQQEDIRRWGALFRDTLRVFRGFADFGGRPPLYVVIPAERTVRLTRTKRRPREKVTGPQMFEIYLTLLMSTLYHDGVHLSPERIDGMFTLARIVNDQPLYHKFYQSIALIYNRQWEFERARPYAEMAYNYWAAKDQSDPTVRLEMALSAYALAGTYHNSDNERALHWLSIAGDLFAKTNYPLQYAVMAGYRGSVLNMMGRYEEALQWTDIALQEIPPDATFYIGYAQQQKGVIQSYLGEYDAAYNNLLEAMVIWRQFENLPRQVQVEHALAFVEARSGRTEGALDRLQYALEMMSNIDENAWKRRLRNKIDTLIDLIEKGDDLSTITPTHT